MRPSKFNSIVFNGLAAKRGFRRFWRAGAAVILELRVGDGVASVRRMVRVRGEFPAKFARANVRRILDAQQAFIKSFGRNRQGEFARLGGSFSHGEGVFTDRRLHLISQELNDDFVAHLAPATSLGATAATTNFLPFLARRRFGGTPSAASTTMMLVTNFFIP